MANENPSHPRWPLATIVGLVVALVLPVATYPLGHSTVGAAVSLARIEIGVVAHWINLALLVAIVILWERRPLASIGLRPLRWWTLPVGIVAGFAITFATGILSSLFALTPDSEFAHLLQSLPLFLRVLLALTAGVFEETLFRGYATERLATLLGNKWLAGACTAVIFTLAHIPAVGTAHILPVGIVTIFITLLYLWRRNLILNMAAHTTVDAIALLLAPLVSR